MSTVSLSEAQARLSEIVDEVGRTHERAHITRNGREYVVLLAAADLESIEATLELLTDPEAQERIRRRKRYTHAVQATAPPTSAEPTTIGSRSRLRLPMTRESDRPTPLGRVLSLDRLRAPSSMTTRKVWREGEG